MLRLKRTKAILVVDGKENVIDERRLKCLIFGLLKRNDRVVTIIIFMLKPIKKHEAALAELNCP